MKHTNSNWQYDFDLNWSMNAVCVFHSTACLQSDCWLAHGGEQGATCFGGLNMRWKTIGNPISIEAFNLRNKTTTKTQLSGHITNAQRIVDTSPYKSKKTAFGENIARHLVFEQFVTSLY